MSNFKVGLILVGILVVLGLVGQMDYESATAEEATYCSMVAKWKSEERAGVPELDRAGGIQVGRSSLGGYGCGARSGTSEIGRGGRIAVGIVDGITPPPFVRRRPPRSRPASA